MILSDFLQHAAELLKVWFIYKSIG
jgi:hypothetical protein